MSFSEKLKETMQDLDLNQKQVVGMTGKSKGSISQYLSGKQIPSEKVQSDMRYFQMQSLTSSEKLLHVSWKQSVRR